MKRKPTITGLVALVASLAALFAIAAPAGQASTLWLYGPYGGVDGFGKTEYTCLGRGAINFSANLVYTGAPGGSLGTVYFQTRAYRLTGSGWVYIGLVRDWTYAGIGGPYRLSFPVGYGTVLFQTRWANWNNAARSYLYTGWLEETFFWSNGTFLGDSNRCTL
jgi:hypothetical protein